MRRFLFLILAGASVCVAGSADAQHLVAKVQAGSCRDVTAPNGSVHRLCRDAHEQVVEIPTTTTVDSNGNAYAQGGGYSPTPGGYPQAGYSNAAPQYQQYQQYPQQPGPTICYIPTPGGMMAGCQWVGGGSCQCVDGGGNTYNGMAQ